MRAVVGSALAAEVVRYCAAARFSGRVAPIANRVAGRATRSGPAPSGRATAGVGAGAHHARSARSPRTRPGSNGQPPSPTAGWAHLYRVDAPWASCVRLYARVHVRRSAGMSAADSRLTASAREMLHRDSESGGDLRDDRGRIRGHHPRHATDVRKRSEMLLTEDRLGKRHLRVDHLLAREEL